MSSISPVVSLHQLDAYLIEGEPCNPLSLVHKEKTIYSSTKIKLERRIRKPVFQNPAKANGGSVGA